MYVCHTAPVHMARTDKPEEVKQWFQDTILGLWPIAMGSLSLRKSPCIREHCRACESGEGHSSYALYGRKGKRRFSIYVPGELAPELEGDRERTRLKSSHGYNSYALFCLKKKKTIRANLPHDPGHSSGFCVLRLRRPLS